MRQTIKLIICLTLFVALFNITNQTIAFAQSDNTPVQGSINGSVFDTKGNPVPGAEVFVHNFQSLQFEKGTLTDQNGVYTIFDLAAGDYIVGVDAFGTNLINEFYNNATTMESATPVTVVDQATTFNIDFVLDSGGSISGLVLDSNGTPVIGMDVSVEDFETDSFVKGGITDSSGLYKIAGVPVGRYRVHVEVFGTSFISEYYDNATDFESSLPVTVFSDQETANIDFVLDLGGSISGRVSGPSGQPIFNIFVSAQDISTDSFVAGEVTDINGNYKISGVPTGSYRVRTDAGEAGFVDEYFDDVTNFESAQPVNVAAGNDTPGIDFVLNSGGSISGFVRDANNQPVAGVGIVVDDFNTGAFAAFAETDFNGNYIVNGVTTGSYLVRTEADFGGFINEYFDNTSNFELATPVKVEVGLVTPNINFVLTTGGSISGVVLDDLNRPISGVEVAAENFDEFFFVNSGQSDVNGRYTISGLPTGSYRVRTFSQDSRIVNEFYDNVISDFLATPVKVTAPNNTSGIDFVLESGGFISGTVVDSNNQPIENIHVDVEVFDTGVFVNAGRTNMKGEYTVTGLPEGVYRVKTSSDNAGFTDKYYDDVIDFELATPVKVTNAGTSNINFVLEIGGSVSGVVLDTQGQPISGINVDAEDFDSDFFVKGAVTDVRGGYTITGLASGRYRIKTNAEDSIFTNEYYDNVFDRSLATAVTVVSPNNTGGIDFVLGSGGSISGNVFDFSGKPMQGVELIVEDFDGNFFVKNGKTDVNGQYLISGLATSTYRVGIDTFGTDFVPQFFKNANWDNATPVPVNAPNETTSIDFVVMQGRFIRGIVTDDNNRPVSGMSLDAFDAETDQFVNFGISDGNGEYSITVPPGSYKVRVNTFETKFVLEFFDNATTQENASIIKVGSDSDAVDINFSLSTGTIIKGRVTDSSNNPVRGLFVNVLDSFTNEWLNGSETDVDGGYAVSVLPGTYRLQVETFGTNFAPASQDRIVVEPGVSEVRIDFALSITNSIIGSVVNAKGVPLPDMFVFVTDDSTTEEFVNFGITDSRGVFAIPVLPGIYFVNVDISGTRFVTPERQKVQVVNGADKKGVDFVLTTGNVISGKVRDSDGLPLKGLFVSAFEFNTGFWVGDDETDSNGDYEIPQLPGVYKVGVSSEGTDFAPVFYDGKGWEDADIVEVLKEGDTVGIDITMVPGSFITGTVTDEDDNPLENVFVDVFDFEKEIWVGSSGTAIEGSYRVVVRPGSYVVRTNAREQGFADKESERVDLLAEGDTVSGVDFVLVTGGFISGNVADGRNGIAGVEVSAFDFDNDLWISSGTTDGSGSYTINGLPSGEYRVRADDLSGNFPGKFFGGNGGVLSWDQAVSVTTVNGQDSGGIDFVLSRGGVVSGVVTDGLNGLANMRVEAFEFNTGLWVSGVETDSSGRYSITLPGGEFRLRALDPNGTFPAIYFDGKINWNEAASLVVEIGQNTLNVDFVLTTGSFITGDVRDETNKLLKGVSIEVFDFDRDSWVNSATSDQNGRYRVPVREGKYRVGAIPFDPRLTPVFYNSIQGNVTSWDDASPVSVTDENSAENINFRLSVGGSIAGKVKDRDSNGIPKISVQVFDFDTDSWINDDITDSDGSFSITVSAGRYRVWALPVDVTSSLSSEFYNNKPGWNLANVVNVTKGNSTVLDDIILSSGSSISGLVIDDNSLSVVGADVSVFDFDTDSWVNSGITNNDGEYKIRGLQRADYRLQALPPDDGANLIAEFYDDVTSWDSAKRVSVTSSDLSGIDFSLSSGGVITGRVTDEDSESTIFGIEISAYNADNDSWVNSGITDGNGNYSIAVSTGTYIVRATASGTDFVDELFENAENFEDARPVVVTTEKSANVNFQLAKGGKIAGAVKDSSGVGISGAEVTSFDFDTNEWVNNTITDSDGAFSINVSSGDYRLYVQAPFGTDFVDEYFDDTSDLNSASLVSVTSPEVTEISDIVLAEGRGIITGNVIGVIGSSSVALEGVKINILDFDADIGLGFEFTDANGDYSASVAPGKYRLFSSFEGTSTTFLNEFYDDSVTAGSATAINVTPSSIETADFILNTGQSINGRVMSAVDLVPLAGVQVVVFSSDSAELVNRDKTDTNGTYSITVPNGTYKVWALPKGVVSEGDTFRPQFFSNTNSFDSAKNVIINNSDKQDINFDLLIQEESIDL